jgi:6-pyruvoyltetrahydropterin/6-carboxytetrahydropterin synthase
LIVEFAGKLNKLGMVIDFYDVEKIIKPIIEELDHSFMVKDDDEIVLEFLNKLNSKKVVVDFVATAENICKFITDKIILKNLPGNIESVGVRIYETCEDYAELITELK